MKPVLTNIVFFLFPQIILSQVVADSTFLFEETSDDFYEFHRQVSLEIRYDSTFYLISCEDIIHRLELINAHNKIIWKSAGIESIQTIPAAIVREKSYSIRVHGVSGVTEVIWFP